VVSDSIPHEIYEKKIIVIGDVGVGKTSILLRFTKDEFRDFIATLGTDVVSKSISTPRGEFKLSMVRTKTSSKKPTIHSSQYHSGIQQVWSDGHPLTANIIEMQTEQCLCMTLQVKNQLRVSISG
jgi:GTPase SAR1 family protein